MTGSKSVALTLLLGAVLLGGVLGFTADRVIRPDAVCQEEEVSRQEARDRFADDVGLNDEQRVRMNILLDARNARLDSIYDSVRPMTRAVRDSASVEFRSMLTPEQLSRLEALRQRDRERHVEGDSAHSRD